MGFLFDFRSLNLTLGFAVAFFLEEGMMFFVVGFF